MSNDTEPLWPKQYQPLPKPDQLSDFTRRALIERALLATADPAGEHNAVQPLSPVRARQILLHLAEPAIGKTSGPGPSSPPVDDEELLRRLGERHEHTFPALADTGATSGILPADKLPEHVDWDSLTRSSVRWNHGTAKESIEGRIWHTTLEVFGVRIGTQIIVSEPGARPSFAVLGLSDLFSHFVMTIAWGSVPPVFELRPVGQVTPQAQEFLRWEIGEDGQLTAKHIIPIGNDDRAFFDRPRLLPALNRATRRRLAKAAR